jgi:hypothetical protein
MPSNDTPCGFRVYRRDRGKTALAASPDTGGNSKGEASGCSRANSNRPKWRLNLDSRLIQPIFEKNIQLCDFGREDICPMGRYIKKIYHHTFEAFLRLLWAGAAPAVDLHP